MNWRASQDKRTEESLLLGIPFDMSDIKAREVNEFVRNSQRKRSPGNDAVRYKV